MAESTNTTFKITIFALISILTVSFVAADQEWEGHRVIYDFEFEDKSLVDEVEVLVYDCDDNTCSEVSEFSGNYDGTTHISEATVDYPKDQIHPNRNIEDDEYNYAVYMYAEGHIPLAYGQTWYCNEYDWCGDTNDGTIQEIEFNRHNNEQANVGSLSVDNLVYEDRSVSLEVPTEISGEVDSPLDSNNRVVDYLPGSDGSNSDEVYNYELDIPSFYQADTDIWLDVNEEEYESESRSIWMDESVDVNYEWSTASEGTYTFEIFSEITDNMFASSNKDSASIEVEIDDDSRYNSILNSLSVSEVEGGEIGDEREISYEYRSYFEEEVIVDGEELKGDTTPVDTDITYEITLDGNVEDSDSFQLESGETTEEDSFTWTPDNAGEHTIEVTAEPVEQEGDYKSDTVTSSTSFEVEESTTNTPPNVNLPSKETISSNQITKLNLNEYVEDETPSENIEWAYNNANNIDVSIDENNEAELDPNGWTGTEEIEFTAEDTDGETGSDTINIESIDNNPPTIDNIDDVELKHSEEILNHADLQEKVSDDNTDFKDLDLDLEVTSGNKCGIEINKNDEIDIKPQDEEESTCTSKLTATDEFGLETTEEFQVEVVLVDPSIISTSLNDAESYSNYQFEAQINSHDNKYVDVVDTNFELLEGPNGLEIDNKGFLTWEYPEEKDEGTHNVKVKINHPEGTDTEEYELNVKEGEETTPPNAALNVDKTSGVAPLTVQFDGSDSTAPDSTINSFKWDFDEGTTKDDSEETLEFTYEQTGTFNPTLTVDNEEGSTDTTTKTIEINAPELNGFTNMEDQEIDEDEDFNYELEVDYNGEIGKLEWEITQNDHIFEMEGQEVNADSGDLTGDTTYTITVEVTDGFGSKIENSFELDINEVDGDNGSNGSNGGSSGGTSGGGGGFSATAEDEETVSLAEKVSFKQKDSDTELDLELSQENVTSHEFELEFREEASLETNMTGNLSEILEIPENITGEGNITVPITLVENITGSYEGEVIFLEKDGEDFISRNISITVPETVEEEVELEDLPLNVYMQDQQSVNDFSYGIRTSDEGIEGELSKETHLLENSTIVYEGEESFDASSLPKRSYIDGEELEPGEYTVEVEITGEDSAYSSTTNIELVEAEELSEPTTGSFFESPTRIMEGFNNHLRELFDFLSF